MIRFSNLLIFLLLATLMASLAWVAWRFFYAPRPQTSPQTEPQPLAPPPPEEPVRPRFQWKWPSWSLPSWNVSFTRLAAPFKRRSTLWLLAPLVLAAIIVTLTLTFSRSFRLDPLTGAGTGHEEKIGWVLGEEKLLPPPPLPPSTFTGTDFPSLEGADRDWKRLDATFVQTDLRLFAKMEQRGYPMALLEGYRSPERQEMLAAKGSHVTQAKAFQSKHQYGLAVDIAPIREGRLVISERDPWAASAYQALGEEATTLGLTWGGRWAMRDLGHVESPVKLSTLMKRGAPPS